MFTEYKNNFLIYYNNLSGYYVICMLISLVAIVCSWFLHFKKVHMVHSEGDSICNDTSGIQNTSDIKDGAEDILTKFKSCKKQTIEKITATMTQEQMEAEKEAEREQLSAILELLKKQEEKFQVGSMEELEGQLRLYR